MDGTARKPVEAKSAQPDKYWRLMVESASDGIFTVGRDGRFDYVNPSLVRMLGTDEAQLLTRHFSDFLLPEDRERITKRFESRMQGNAEPSVYELNVRTARGTTFWAEISLTLLRGAGHFTGVLGFLRDISQRKEVENSFADLRARLEQRVAERTHEMRLANRVLEEQIEHARAVTQQLQASEAKWRSLVEHAPQYVILLDNQRRLLFLNRTAPGYDMENVVGSDVLRFIPERNRPFASRILERVFAEGVSECFEIDAHGLNGQAAWYSVSIAPILSRSGEPATTAVMIAADITERKATEEALQKRQLELAHISRLNTMGALTAELAHELNQPLQAISAYASGCLRSMNGDEAQAARVETALHNISLQSSRASLIIRKIMDFLRKGDLPRQTADVNRLIRDVVGFVELDARQHEVRIECDLSAGLPEIPVNRVQIEQVLFNLLFNAIDAVRSVDVGKRCIRVVSRPGGVEDVEISVHDDGPGFSPAKADELFQPFFTTKAKGMGMGLSISRMIIDEHGGRIWATSKPGGGTTLTFVLPASSTKSGG